MMRWSLLGLALFCQSTTLAHDRRMTVSLERLWGFERHVHAAAQEVRFPVPLLGPGTGADYRVYLSPLFRNELQQKMYRKSTGRMEDSILELYDHRGNKFPVTHLFQMQPCQFSRQREAREFLNKIKRHLTAP
jgi:hypothetical protein